MQNIQDPHGEVQRARSLRLCKGTEDYIDSGLAGDLRNKVGPATGKRATPDLDSLSERRYALRPDGSFDTKPDVEHVLRCGQQINVNLESAIFDRSLHEDLRFQHHRKTRQITCRPVFPSAIAVRRTRVRGRKSP